MWGGMKKDARTERGGWEIVRENWVGGWGGGLGKSWWGGLSPLSPLGGGLDSKNRRFPPAFLANSPRFQFLEVCSPFPLPTPTPKLFDSLLSNLQHFFNSLKKIVGVFWDAALRNRHHVLATTRGRRPLPLLCCAPFSFRSFDLNYRLFRFTSAKVFTGRP